MRDVKKMIMLDMILVWWHDIIFLGWHFLLSESNVKKLHEYMCTRCGNGYINMHLCTWVLGGGRCNKMNETTIFQDNGIHLLFYLVVISPIFILRETAF